jgi:MoaA/NifB/PqqE/SkfB family radical SAM enzyme
MVPAAEAARRASARMTGRLQSLPILALSIHSACNCRCVMCDIWKANANKREISPEALASHVAAIRDLYVKRVMLTGGEPLLNRDVWMLCALLRSEGIAVTLVTTGLLLDGHADAIASNVDTVVVSLDGPADVHDAIRRVPGGFDKIHRGVSALQRALHRPLLIARSVVQRANHSRVGDTIAAARDIGFDELSFLAADLSSKAFNRPEPWSDERKTDIAIPADELPAFEDAIERARAGEEQAFESGFIVGGVASLMRIHRYYSAVAGRAKFPKVRCNAPWVSAVLEPDGAVRPCFFHDAYPTEIGDLRDTLNSPRAIGFRKALDVDTNPTCQRCVCSLNLPIMEDV